jgi:hypothetical protein
MPAWAALFEPLARAALTCFGPYDPAKEHPFRRVFDKLCNAWKLISRKIFLWTSWRHWRR